MAKGQMRSNKEKKKPKAEHNKKKQEGRRRSPGFAVQPGPGPGPARLQSIWEEGIAAGTRPRIASEGGKPNASRSWPACALHEPISVFPRSNGACITTIL